jgi:hypothetical protein
VIPKERFRSYGDLQMLNKKEKTKDKKDGIEML